MRLIFVEYYWQVEEISKNKEKFINDIIISLFHETSYLLMSKKIDPALLCATTPSPYPITPFMG